MAGTGPNVTNRFGTAVKQHPTFEGSATHMHASIHTGKPRGAPGDLHSDRPRFSSGRSLITAAINHDRMLRPAI